MRRQASDEEAGSLLMRRECSYRAGVTKAAPTNEALNSGAEHEPGYAAWKRAKVERGLAESEDRDAMIPAAQVWRDLGLER